MRYSITSIYFLGLHFKELSIKKNLIFPEEIKNQIQKDISSQNTQLLLTANEYGIKTIQNLSHIKDLIKIHISHQVLKNYFELINKVNIYIFTRIQPRS